MPKITEHEKTNAYLLPKSVYLCAETFEKWKAIRKGKRWTWAETADALADVYISRHGLGCSIESARVPEKPLVAACHQS